MAAAREVFAAGEKRKLIRVSRGLSKCAAKSKPYRMKACEFKGKGKRVRLHYNGRILVPKSCFYPEGTIEIPASGPAAALEAAVSTKDCNRNFQATHEEQARFAREQVDEVVDASKHEENTLPDEADLTLPDEVDLTNRDDEDALVDEDGDVEENTLPDDEADPTNRADEDLLVDEDGHVEENTLPDDEDDEDLLVDEDRDVEENTLANDEADPTNRVDDDALVDEDAHVDEVADANGGGGEDELVDDEVDTNREKDDETPLSDGKADGGDADLVEENDDGEDDLELSDVGNANFDSIMKLWRQRDTRARAMKGRD